MVRTASTMTDLGREAPDFHLPDPRTGTLVSLDDFAGAPALLVVFLSNHCPYVKHIQAALAEFAEDYQERGLGVVGINANDTQAYPDDAPDRMVEDAHRVGYTFPYLFDESQRVAQAYRAACTPDFFLFDGERRLVYRGQFDDSRPGSGVPVTGADLRRAADAVLAGGRPDAQQVPSVGCNIKWKKGNEPDYFGA